MKKLFLMSSAVAAISFAGAFTTASAAVAPAEAPLAVSAAQLPSASVAPDGSVKLAHGWHWACQRGYYGWHRHTRWGRRACGGYGGGGY